MRRPSDYGTDRLQIAIYAPDPNVLRWIRVELDDVAHDEHVVDTPAALCALLDEEADEPIEAVVVDFDAMTSADLVLLERVRVDGFAGGIVALGGVALETERRLRINIVLRRPLGSEGLRTAIEGLADSGGDRITAVDR
jgi:hypothetical protein